MQSILFWLLFFGCYHHHLWNTHHMNTHPLWGDIQTPNSDILEFSLSFRFELNCVWFGIVCRYACTTHLFIGKWFLNGIFQYQTVCLLLYTHSTEEDLNACHEGLQVIISWMLLKITSTLARLTNSRHPTIHCTVLVASSWCSSDKDTISPPEFKRPSFGSSPRVIISRYI